MKSVNLLGVEFSFSYFFRKIQLDERTIKYFNKKKILLFLKIKHAPDIAVISMFAFQGQLNNCTESQLCLFGM